MRSLISLLPVLVALLAEVDAAPACFDEVSCEDYSTPTKRSVVKRATWLPAQGGCWQDNADGVRALEHGLGGFDDLTPAKCQSMCEAQGFNLSGVEYSRECCKYTGLPWCTYG
jgi:hypothetical protein